MSKEKTSKVQVLRNRTMSNVESLRKMWLGDILTLAESSFPDLEQRKSFKKVATRIFWSQDERWTGYITQDFKQYAESIGEAIVDDEVVGLLQCEEASASENPFKD